MIIRRGHLVVAVWSIGLAVAVTSAVGEPTLINTMSCVLLAAFLWRDSARIDQL